VWRLFRRLRWQHCAVAIAITATAISAAAAHPAHRHSNKYNCDLWLPIVVADFWQPRDRTFT
jgi:hypothetical protein